MRPVAVLCGVGSYLPPTAVSNDDLSQRLDTTDEWILTRTGIANRFFASRGTATSDLAVSAAERALKCAEVDGVDAVVLATTTPDRPCPATAPVVAAKLGLSGVAAFDVGAVCTGFLYALSAAAGLIATETAERVLVIGADTYSTIVDPSNRSDAVIFGDGAGAVVLRAGTPGEPGAVGPFDLGSDGDHRDLITIRAGGSEQRLSGAEPRPEDHYFSMSGKKVFQQAIVQMAGSVRGLLRRAGLEIGQVDRMVGHQANQRILTRLADVLGLPEDRNIGNIREVGNTAGASIPIALDDGHRRGLLSTGDQVLLTAFGGGLTWGSALLTWPDLHHTDRIRS
ncbi:beta-ketoacyl-ACP synthase III [Actinokineospora guangxiensis]|uniref:Beta-ketoacyl-[acyl-carrier-protein] synthase III n=1 Tax=Actinokineospora guangxiensis TaxID=1490288 RepID=A0ABW0EW35_9PSEU